MFSFEKRRLMTVSAVVALLLILFLCLRAYFVIAFSGIEHVPDLTTAIVAKALYLGVKFDFRLALLVALPVIVLAYLPRIGLYHARATRIVLHWYLSGATFLLLLFYVFDFGHYDYLARRIDSTALRFLEDASISARMLWESYPVLEILAGVLAVTAAWHWCYGRILARAGVAGTSSRGAYWLSVAICFLAVFGGIFGRFNTQMPLRWSEAFFTSNNTVAAIALNPVLYFFDTFENREDIVDVPAVRAHYDAVAQYLGVDHPDREKLNYLRTVAPSATGRRPNVIVVMLESLGAVRLGAFGNPLHPTPNLDRLTRESLFFPHFYVPVPGTARTVWASITGLPDVSRIETATRNPFIVEQHTIINDFRGYRKFYFTGGSAGWANMRALVQHNIPDLELYEEGSYTEPEVDVWGISDLSLFREVDKVLSKIPEDQPFFAYIQTAGNHRPFTIPEDNDGFTVDPIPEETAHANGFTTPAQYNAVRLLDHTIGRFIEMANKSGYLNRTIVVMFGDHNNNITTLPYMPPAYERLDLESLAVPFIIYGRGFIEPRRIEATMSLMDVLPTVAGLAGIGYRNTTIGRDILSDPNLGDRWVYVQERSKASPKVAVVGRDYLVNQWYDGTGIELHDLHSAHPERDVSREHPDLTAQQAFLAKGIYETTKYLMYHNPNLPPVSLTMSE